MRQRSKSACIMVILIILTSIFVGESTRIMASQKKVTAIGDSVVLGAASSIKKAIPGCTVVIALGTNGVHLKSKGQVAYAKMIQNKIK